MNNRNLFLAVWERDVYTRGQTRPSPAPTSHSVPTRWGHRLPGASFTRTLRPLPPGPPWGPRPSDLLAPKPPPALPWGWAPQSRVWGPQAGLGCHRPTGLSTVWTPRAGQRLGDTKPCSRGYRPAAGFQGPRCSPPVGLLPRLLPGWLPSAMPPQLSRCLCPWPRGPHGLSVTVAPLDPGTGSLVPSRGRRGSRPLSRLVERASAFSGCRIQGEG